MPTHLDFGGDSRLTRFYSLYLILGFGRGKWCVAKVCCLNHSIAQGQPATKSQPDIMPEEELSGHILCNASDD